MVPQGYQQYKAQSVNTMTPGELLMVLYDELVKRVGRAELALGKQDYALFEASITRSIEIVEYLDDTLDQKYEISHELHRLYDYFTYILGRIKIGRNAELLAKVKPQITEMRDTFREAQKKESTP